MSKLANKPLSISQIISQSIQFCCQSYKYTGLFALVVAACCYLGMIAFALPARGLSSAILMGVIALLLIIFALIVGVSTYAALIMKCHHFLTHKDTDSHCDCRAGLKYFWPLIAALVLIYVSMAIGFSLFVLPGIFLAICFIIYLPLMVSENKGPLCAYRDSIVLTWGNWWRTLLIAIFAGFCYVIAYAVVAAIFGILIHLIGLHLHHYHFLRHVIYSLVTLVVYTFFCPWFIMLALVLINDFKLRKS